MLCLQETWLRGGGGDELIVPGFSVHEQRRCDTTGGGLAVLVRTSLKVLETTGNEYAQQVQLGLPDGTKLVVNNVYLPPQQSLSRRDIDEHDARAAVEAIVTATPALHHRITCGDLNARIGDAAPCVQGRQLTRTTADAMVCRRATWCMQLCELAEQHVLNGNEFQT